LLLVFTYRPTEASAQLVHIVANWSRENIVRRLDLARLTLAEATELIASLGGDLSLAEELQNKSAGNPYFLIELTRAAPGDTPPELAELIRSRLSQLPEAARQVLQAAAVLETNFDFSTLRRTSGRGEEETLNALDALLEANVLTEHHDGYDFAHPLVAGVVRENLGLARRSFLHRRAAEALTAIHANHLAPMAGQLATHYAQAGRPAQAAYYADMAARRALDLAAPAEAADLYRLAFRLEPTPPRQMNLARTLYVLGDLTGAQEVLLAVLAEFEARADRSGVVQVCLELALSYLPYGQAGQTVYWAERALSQLDSPPEPEFLARIHHLLGAARLRTDNSLAAAEHHLRLVDDLAAEHDLSEIAALSSFEFGNLLAQRGDLAQAIQKYHETIASAQAAGNLFQEVLGYNNLAYHTMLAKDLATARQQLEQGLALAETHSLFLPRQYLYSTRGEIALAEGQFEEADQWFQQALAEAEAHDNQSQGANIRANLGLVARQRGDFDEALLLLETARNAVTELSDAHLQTQIDLWLAELYLQRGEQAAAQEALTRAETRLSGSDRHGLIGWVRRIRTELGGFSPLVTTP
jgi:predicted ATPase